MARRVTSGNGGNDDGLTSLHEILTESIYESGFSQNNILLDLIRLLSEVIL